ncbi:MAG TPA: hypothetical protein EYP87_01125, partial [Flavobacteriaceae bacterium]|nr:hypothetical protein [Flavobacteriaceae bacterium]
PFLDLYEAVIESNGQISDVKNLSARLDSKYHESNVAFAPDLKSVYFTRNNIKEEDTKVIEVKDNSPRRGRKRGENTKIIEKDKTINLSIYRADVTYDGTWKNIAPLPFNSKNYSIGHPTVSKDGKKLYFTSDMPGSYGMSDIFVVDIKEDGTFSRPENLGKKINTLGKEMFPFIDENNILYFASDSRKGGFGGLDIYAVKIYENSLSEVIHLGAPINTEKDDFSLIINNDNNQGYFSSNRKGGIGDDDIYHFVANPPVQFECDQLLVGVVKDDNGKTLKDVNISILNNDGKEISSTTTKSNGGYKINIPCDSKIKIVGTKFSYLDDEKELVLENNPEGKAQVDLQLTKIVVCKQSVNLQVQNIRTSKPIPYAMVNVYDMKGRKISTEKADKRGAVNFDLPCSKEFRITATKDKYDNSEILFKSNKGGLTQKAVLNMKLTPDLTEVKILKNKVIVNINPIYFPLNSATITPTSATELNKVVDIMRKYPKLKIEGGSHTDSRGGHAYNLDLSIVEKGERVTAFVVFAEDKVLM